MWLAGLAAVVATGPGQAAHTHAATAGAAHASSATAGPAETSPNTRFTLVVTDPLGQGFNDGRPADPGAGDNQAATLGQQRLRVLQHAAAIWAERIASPVPIRVEIELAQLPCEADRTVLGWAGPTYVVRDFAGAPRPNTHYPVALANALAGRGYNITSLVVESPDGRQQTLRMPLEERIERWQALDRAVREQDIAWWRRTYLDALDDVATKK